MKIAIDASRSIDGVQKTGVEIVSDALLKKMQETRPDGVDLSYYTPQKISSLPEMTQRVITWKRFWTLGGLSLAMRRDKPDALFVPVHTLPFFCPKKTVKIIHDISFFRRPEAYSLRERTYMRFDLWRTKRICRYVVVPTEAIKKDLVELVGFAADRIVVTGWGSVDVQTGRRSVSRTNESAPFILFIGRIEEKKNVANLIRAFAIFRESHPTWELILAGKPGHGYEAIEPLLITPGVRALGYISNEEKNRLLLQSSMMAIVSKEEGFSFPMLEAFSYNIPVVASSIPVLQEIGQEAVVYAEPENIQDIAETISCVADDAALRERLIAAGKIRLEKYSWDEVVKKIWKLLSEQIPTPGEA